MKRILFVEGDKRELLALKSRLQAPEIDWQMDFAKSGTDALQKLASEPFDVIVTGLRLLDMQGHKLLGRIRENYPEVLRLALASAREGPGALNSLHLAHEILPKPCEMTLLREVIDRGCRLQELMSNRRLKSLVGEIGQLPTLPSTYGDLNKALMDPNVAIPNIGDIVKKDFSMCAKLLQIVNSAYFGLPRRISDINAAINFIGIEMLRTLVLSVGVFDSFDFKKTLPGFKVEKLQEHAFQTGNIARRLVVRDEQASDAFMAGMLHDIGQLVLAAKMSDTFGQILQERRETGIAQHLLEREAFGVTHAEVGAYLLGLWGIPQPIVEAVAHHHEPWRVEQEEFDMLGAVYVAGVLSDFQEEYVVTAKQDETLPSLSEFFNMEYLKKLGKDDEIALWAQIAQVEAMGEAAAG